MGTTPKDRSAGFIASLLVMSAALIALPPLSVSTLRLSVSVEAMLLLVELAGVVLLFMAVQLYFAVGRRPEGAPDGAGRIREICGCDRKCVENVLSMLPTSELVDVVAPERTPFDRRIVRRTIVLLFTVIYAAALMGALKLGDNAMAYLTLTYGVMVGFYFGTRGMEELRRYYAQRDAAKG